MGLYRAIQFNRSNTSFLEMKVVCINDSELGKDSYGKPRYKKLPLTRGKTYENLNGFHMNEFVAVVSDDNGEKRLYPSVNFVTLDVWRQMQLNKLI